MLETILRSLLAKQDSTSYLSMQTPTDQFGSDYYVLNAAVFFMLKIF